MKSAIITRFHETHITDYKITTMVSQTDLINQSMEITDYEITPIHFTEENLIQKLNEMSVECQVLFGGCEITESSRNTRSWLFTGWSVVAGMLALKLTKDS